MIRSYGLIEKLLTGFDCINGDVFHFSIRPNQRAILKNILVQADLEGMSIAIYKDASRDIVSFDTMEGCIFRHIFYAGEALSINFTMRKFLGPGTYYIRACNRSGIPAYIRISDISMDLFRVGSPGFDEERPRED